MKQIFPSIDTELDFFGEDFSRRAGLTLPLSSIRFQAPVHRTLRIGRSPGSKTSKRRRGFVFEVAYHKKIGVSPEKKPLKTLRVVDEAGRVVTAFPVK